MRGATRPLSAVPRWICALLAAVLVAQAGWQTLRAGQTAHRSGLPSAPSSLLLRAASFGEPEFVARIAMLYLQAFDLSSDNAVPYQHLDYARVIAWLRSILETDPHSAYALFSAARIYAENPDASKCRSILKFLHEAFERDPDRRWPWLAHAALVAKHRLRDLPLALQYARAIDREVRDPSAPVWAKQMQIFILEDMNELDAAKIMLGGLIASGRVRDPGEREFLRKRLYLMGLPGRNL